jgi:hypothetical protein
VSVEVLLRDAVEGERCDCTLKAWCRHAPLAVGAAPARKPFIFDPDHAFLHTLAFLAFGTLTGGERVVSQGGCKIIPPRRESPMKSEELKVTRVLRTGGQARMVLDWCPVLGWCWDALLLCWITDFSGDVGHGSCVVRMRQAARWRQGTAVLLGFRLYHHGLGAGRDAQQSLAKAMRCKTRISKSEMPLIVSNVSRGEMRPARGTTGPKQRRTATVP